MIGVSSTKRKKVSKFDKTNFFSFVHNADNRM